MQQTIKKPLKPEQRQWTISQSLIVETRKREGHCKKCHKKLSSFNLSKYCFNHQYIGTKEEDKRRDEFAKAQYIKYKKYCVKKYKKEKNENTFTDSQRTKENCTVVL